MATTWGSLTTRLLEKAKENRTPFAGSFELTARCNFQCRMCYVCRPASCKESISRERSASEWISMAKEVRDAGALFITLTGGEIFLRKDLQQIYEGIATMGYRITLYTNGSLVTPQIAKWLGRIPPSMVSVTLYGASEDTYGVVCGMPQGFGMTVRGIDALLEEGVKVEIKTTVIHSNYRDYEKMAMLAMERGIELSVVDYISPRREGSFSDPVGSRLTPAELARYVHYVDEYRRLHNMGSDAAKVDGIEMDEKMVEDEKFRSSADAFRCAAGKCAFWVSWDGRLLPCGLLDEPSALPFESGFANAWEELKDKCRAVPDCKDCKSCELLGKCRFCPARLKAETGYFDKAASYFCELTRETLLAEHK